MDDAEKVVEFLRNAMLGLIEPTRKQMESAKALLAYYKKGYGDIGKKDKADMIADSIAEFDDVFGVFKGGGDKVSVENENTE